MTKRDWPKTQKVDGTIDDGFSYTIRELKSTTSCKHGRYGCSICGTTDRRDAKHTTRGGKGAVAKLMGKKR